MNNLELDANINIWNYSTGHIGQVCRVFANGQGDLGSISGRFIPKTLKNGTWCLHA